MWSDSELTEIKSEVVKKEDPDEGDTGEAFLEELLDDEEVSSSSSSIESAL